MEPECVPCLIKRCIYETKLVSPGKECQATKVALKVLSSLYREGVVSAEVATVVHKQVYDLLEDNDPYREIKEHSNLVAEKLLPRARELVEEWGFRGAVLVSIVGNVMDFGFRDDFDSPELLTEMFEELVKEGIGYDDSQRIEKLLNKARRVVYLTDNCGEIVLDIPLLEAIKGKNTRLTLVVKGEPVLTDATMEDVDRYGIQEVVDQVLTTGGFAVGVDLENMPEELEEEMKMAELIIAKGMANWESLSETSYKPIAYLTRSKCGPVARSMGVEEDINVAKLFE